MAIDRQRQNVSYGLSQALIGLPPSPIVSARAPTTGDKAEIGTLWVNKTTSISYTLIKVSAGSATWYPITTAGVDVIAASFTATTGDFTATLGDVVVDAGDVLVTLGGIGVDVGDIVLALGDVDLTAGDVNVIAGAIVVDAGDVTTVLGDFIADAGDVTVTLGGIGVDAGDIVVGAGNITATLGNITAGADIAGRTFFATGDEGTGNAGETGFTNVVDTTVSTGAGVVLLKTANPGDSAGWLKMYDGTTVVWVPFWTNISP